MIDELISVVVPVGRVDAHLREEVDALMRQDTDRLFEVVLARNSDDPQAVAALDALVAELGDDRFRVVDAATRRGAAHARNAGAAAAKGAVLAFCDADDVVDPAWLGELVTGLDSFDAASGHVVDLGLSDRQTGARPPTTPDALPTFLGVPYLLSGNLTIRRDLFEEMGGFDEDLIRCEDIAFSWRLLGAGHSIGFVPSASLAYRHRPGMRAMIEQHFHYGRGMAQVLSRYGVPTGQGWDKPSGLGLLKPNGQRVGKRSFASVARRGALAAGRVTGIVEERMRNRRAAS